MRKEVRGCLILISVPIFALSAFAAAEQKTAFHCSSELSVRNGHRLTYSSDRKKTLLFGGADASRVLGDLWEWNGKNWSCLDSSPQLARTFPAMAYDSGRKRAVIFGGNRVLFGRADDAETFLDDTWEWNGKKWTKIETMGPPARAEAVMVYDAKRRRVVLFGGYIRKNGQTIRLGDTWEYDGKKWTQAASSGPSSRSGAAMAYDSDKQESILFGGNGRLNDTWKWDGERWSNIATNEVEGRFNTMLAYDAKRRQLIRFGGWNGSARVGDTWSLIGKTWKALDVTGPEPRNHSAMVYDPARQRVVLFGGHDGENVFGDTWEWDGGKWMRVDFTEKQKRVANEH